MSTLSGDLRQLIESDQQTARPVLRDLAERLPRSIEARSLLAQSYLRSLELTPALENYRLAHELEPNNLGLRHQMGLCAIAPAMQVNERQHGRATTATLQRVVAQLGVSA